MCVAKLYQHSWRGTMIGDVWRGGAVGSNGLCAYGYGHVGAYAALPEMTGCEVWLRRRSELLGREAHGMEVSWRRRRVGLALRASALTGRRCRCQETQEHARRCVVCDVCDVWAVRSRLCW